MEYPSFFEAHLQDVAHRFLDAKSKMENGVGFIFLTDVHIHLNGRASTPLILELGRRTGVNTVLCGGDHCWAFGSKAQCIADLQDSLHYLDPIRQEMQLFHARGNHDATVRSSWELETGYTMPYAQLQPLFACHSCAASGAVEGKLYFYHDDQKARMRYVVVDTTEHHREELAAWGVETGMTSQQLQWLAGTALRLPDDGWSVVVMGHISCIDAFTASAEKLMPLREILTAFRHRTACEYGDFSAAFGNLVAYLSGHSHQDRMKEENGVVHISTGCDAYCKDDNLPRDVGCIQNTLFDLFLVDPISRHVQVFRIGAGSDRSFTY